MLAFAVRIALDDDGLGVVEENVFGHATEVVERLAEAGAQRGDILARAGDELHVAGAAVAQRGHQRDQRITAAANVGEVGLHLLARRRLKAHQRFGLVLLQWRQPRLELADATGIAALANLAQQHGGRNPSWRA